MKPLVHSYMRWPIVILKKYVVKMSKEYAAQHGLPLVAPLHG